MSGTTFASPALRTIFRQRLGQLCGIGIALAGLVLLVALLSYNSHDPSMNTATSRSATNLLGLPGALIADVLVQYFGVGAGVPVMALLAWAYRVATTRPLRLGTRMLFLLLGLPLFASALGMVQGLMAGVASFSFGWNGGAAFGGAGLGGAVGLELGALSISMGRGLMGPVGGLVVLGAEVLIGCILLVWALGLTIGEWRAAGRGAVGVARGSVRGGREAAGVMGRTGAGAAGAARAVLGPVRRFLELREELALPAVPAEAPVRVGVESVATAVAREAAVVAGPESAPTAAARGGAGVRTPQKPVPKMAVVGKRAGALEPVLQSVPVAENGWEFPPLSLLSPPPKREDVGIPEEALQANARLLEQVLSDYGVQGAIREIRPGPVVTLYELEPAPGIRSARVIGLADDVARSLCVTAVRIATVPGRNVIGIEVPNAKRETVFLSELLGSSDWAMHPGKLALALGKDIGGGPIIADLARMPHLLIAGDDRVWEIGGDQRDDPEHPVSHEPGSVPVDHDRSEDAGVERL